MNDSFNSFTTCELSTSQLAYVKAGCPCPGGDPNEDSDDTSNGG